MKESLVLSILKTEGIGEQSTCHIILNDDLQSTLSIQDTKISENCIELPLSGTLKLLVTSPHKNSSKFYVSLNIQSFPSEGTVWLPLYTSLSEETLPAIPSILPNTKVLVSVNQLSSLTPVPEITETESSVFDMDNSFVRRSENSENTQKNWFEQYKKALIVVNDKNKQLRRKICEVQDKLQVAQEENRKEKWMELQGEHEMVSKLAIQVEKYKIHAGNLQSIHEDHVKQVDSLQLLLKQEVLQREYLEKQVLRITTEYRDYIKIAENRFASYEQSLLLKQEEINLLKQTQQISLNLSASLLEPDSQLTHLQTQLHNTLEQLQESEFNRKLLQSKLESSAQRYSKDLQDLLSAPKITYAPNNELVQELKKYREKCAELENLLDDKYVQIKSQDSLCMEKEVNLLREQLKAEKVVNEQLVNQMREKTCKELEVKLKGADEKFVEYLKVYEIEDKFQKVSEGIFAYGGKKVGVAIKNGCMICRIGGGYMGVEKFIKTYLADKDNENFHKRSQTAGVVNGKLEDTKVKGRLSLVAKENCDEIKGVKTNSRIFQTKSMTPNRDSVYKRVFK